MLRGAIQAISNGASVAQGDVLGLARDVLLLQPPVAGTREARLLSQFCTQIVAHQESILRENQSHEVQGCEVPKGSMIMFN